MIKKMDKTDIENTNRKKGPQRTKIHYRVPVAGYFDCQKWFKKERIVGAIQHREGIGRKQDNECNTNSKVQSLEKEKHHVK